MLPFLHLLPQFQNIFDISAFFWFLGTISVTAVEFQDGVTVMVVFSHDR